MKTFKGTKGPWAIRIDSRTPSGVDVYSGKGRDNKTIVHMPYGMVVPPRQDDALFEFQANAKLISASPELLDSLQEMISVVESAYSLSSSGKRKQGLKARLDKAKAVINKALD